MSLTDRERHDAYEALAETFGDRTDSVITMLRTDDTNLLTTGEFRAAMGHVDEQAAGFNRRFEQIDQRFEQIDQRFEQIDQRFGLIDVRFERIDTKFAEQRVEFRREIHEAFAAQTRTLVIGLISAVVLVALTNALAIIAG